MERLPVWRPRGGQGRHTRGKGRVVAAGWSNGTTALDAGNGDPGYGAGGRAPALEDDPQYAVVIMLMQQGDWPRAAGALADLARRYEDSPRIRSLQGLLALKLSAEETWRGRGEAPLSPLRNPRLTRTLLIADLIICSLLIALWLLAKASGIP